MEINMKLLEKVNFKDKYSSIIVESYELNDFLMKDLQNVGLRICYLLSINSKLSNLELMPEQEEIGIPLKWYRQYNQSTFNSAFSSLEDFLNAFDRDDFDVWSLDIFHENIKVGIGGDRTSFNIRVVYDEKDNVNILPFLYEIETKSYDYNDYDKTVMKLLKDQYKQTTKRAVLTIEKLMRHQDIYDEFVKRSFLAVNEKIDNPITVQGFTAEQLHNNFPLSILGSYNYLIFLREKPEEALEKLKQGLPRK